MRAFFRRDCCALIFFHVSARSRFIGRALLCAGAVRRGCRTHASLKRVSCVEWHPAFAAMLVLHAAEFADAPASLVNSLLVALRLEASLKVQPDKGIARRRPPPRFEWGCQVPSRTDLHSGVGVVAITCMGRRRMRAGGGAGVRSRLGRPGGARWPSYKNTSYVP